MTEREIPRHDVFRALLELGSKTVFIHFATTEPDVLVPEVFEGRSHLVLEVGHNMPIAIRELRVDDLGIFGYFYFSKHGGFQRCFVPWHRIFTMVGKDGRGYAWKEDMPDDVIAAVTAGHNVFEEQKEVDLEEQNPSNVVNLQKWSKDRIAAWVAKEFAQEKREREERAAKRKPASVHSLSAFKQRILDGYVPPPRRRRPKASFINLEGPRPEGTPGPRVS